MSTTTHRTPAHQMPQSPGRRPIVPTRVRKSPPKNGPHAWYRWRRVHGRAPLWLLPTLLITAVVQAWNMAGSPQRIDDEGTYVAQAWAITNLGELAHYTYWYDHPPLGWIQIAGYAQLTGAFDRWDTSVMAGREAMLVAAVISTALLWLLARKTGLGRGMATLAALLFALSPLAIQFHRTVYLDNIATAWLLGALILAMSRKHQLAEFVGAAVMFGIAVLTKETYLLALPLLAWVMFHSAYPATRRYTLAVASTMLVLVGSGYILFAAVKGELLPGDNRVSLFDGIAFQLSSRVSSGSITDPDSLINRTLAMWWQLDPVFITTGIVSTLAGLFIKRLRPYAVLVVGLVLFMFRPGSYLPVPYVIMLIPFAALCIAGVTSWILAHLRRGNSAGKRVSAMTGIAGLIIAVVIAVPLWTTQLRGMLLANLDASTVQAQDWITSNVPLTDRLIVDDAMWVDLVKAGFARDNVIWYYKLDTDSDVMDASPNGWQDSDYIVTTDSMRTFPDQFPQIAQALNNSEIVASFGEGFQQVDVRRIFPEGLAAREEATAERAERLSSVGIELVTNPSLTFEGETVSLLEAGQIDARILAAIGQRASLNALTIASFPVVHGESGTMRRQVLFSASDGVALAPGSPAADDLQRWLESLNGFFAVSSVTQTQDGVLATFSTVQPTNLLPSR